MKKDKWVWMPHPGHFICCNDCRFHLNTYVGGYIVSTVGEYEPDMAIRERYAQSRGIVLEGMGDARRDDAMKKLGYEKLGIDRIYETMVFPAVRGPKVDGCCPWRMSDCSSIDFAGYNTAEDARIGHMKLCQKWAKKMPAQCLSRETKEV